MNGYLKRFFAEEPKTTWRGVMIMSGCSGLANGALLGIINGGAAAASESEAKLRYLTLFIIAMSIFCYAKKVSMTSSIRTIEEMLHRLRVRVIQKLRKSELEDVEKFGKGDVYTKISQDTMTVSQSAFFLVNIAQSAIMVLCCLVYVAWLSPWAFVVTVIAIGLALTVYWAHRKNLTENMAEMADKEAELVDVVSHLLDGFKEVRVNTRKNNAVYETYTDVVEESKALKIVANDTFTIEIMFSQVFFYLLIAAIVFVLPQFVPTYSEVVIKTTAAILFIVGPLDMIATTAPLVARSNAALKNLYELEDRIDALPSDSHEFKGPSRYAGFQSIKAQGLCYTYRDEGDGAAFRAGPLDLDIRRGEVIFFVGGNGCGKTTIMKLLTGLYRPEAGALLVDDRAIPPSGVQDYRELFSPIFTDFHLFDRLYGLEDVDPVQVSDLLLKMEIAHKTTFEGGRFSDLKLSTGQRKRLALIAAMLEDREILMFDEWAADQDPHFRRFFYEDLLQEFRTRGKTVLAVSHDDHFWHAADRVIRIDYGRIERIDTVRSRDE